MQRGSRLAPGHCLPIPSSNCSAHRLAGPLEPCARGRSPRYAVPRHRNRPDLLGRGGSRNRLLIAQRVDAGHARAGKGAVACGRGLGWVDDGVPLRIVEPPVLLNGKRVEEVGQFVFEGHEGRPQRRHIPAAREERAQCRRRAVGQRRTQALQPSAHGGLQRRPIGIRDLVREQLEREHSVREDICTLGVNLVPDHLWRHPPVRARLCRQLGLFIHPARQPKVHQLWPTDRVEQHV
mmetsp:Transcript_13057/g.42773  ORF Transcript_13057/g.42773 Transcript_13057/m.42773 type:complete len:236 (+) Transcript_13057:725-1432(+)